MNPTIEFEKWVNSAVMYTSIMEELQQIRNDKEEIADRFYRHLGFGTGGLRGKLGAGTNRMNNLTVGRATQGLATYLCTVDQKPVVCIAYDTRIMSAEFARHAARVLCANGIRVYLYTETRPTPMLSYAVRHMQANAGIVITASHNPREYNGYKVYGSDGGQITDQTAADILMHINACDLFGGVKLLEENEARQTGLLRDMPAEVDNAYFQKVHNLSLRRQLVKEKANDLNILYTPLHGSGNVPVRRILREQGYTQVNIVPQQELPDGTFPTTPYPNPEDPTVFELAIEMAGEINPDLIFATDPDCDRIGVLARDDAGEYVVLTGNQVGALLCDYMIRAKKEMGELPANAAVVKTIVTTDLAKNICSKHGVCVVETLTGFKYIGEKIGEWENSGQYSFLLGFEESYGYLAGDFVRDKDAVIAAMLIAEMALYYKDQGKSLFQAVNNMYACYGYASEKLLSVTMSGAEGQRRIAQILSDLRENHAVYFSGDNLRYVEDYECSQRLYSGGAPSEKIDLPHSNVLKFVFDDDSWLVWRPSGTEPKIKLYLSAIGACPKQTAQRLRELEEVSMKFLDA